MANPTGAGGWPLVSSKMFPGELCLCCPRCGSRNITMATVPGAYGTAPGGRWRMGDYGGAQMNRCEDCKLIHTYQTKDS